LLPGAVPTPAEFAQYASGLQMMGPRIVIEIAVPDAVAAQIVAAGGTIPQPVVGSALIDTGASNTSIDAAVGTALALQVMNTILVSTPSGQTPHHVYPVKLAFPGTHLPLIPFQPVTGVQLANQGLIALLGRDFLSGKMLHYDAAYSTVTLSW
jgi:hypothetical protein